LHIYIIFVNIPASLQYKYKNMDNTFFLGAIVGPYMLIIGLSLLLYAKVWVKLLKDMEKNHTAVFIGVAFALILGLAIIQMHNIWEWSIWVVITIFGWSAFLKGLFYFLAPGMMIKAVIKTFSHPGWMYFAGVILAMIGGYMSYLVYLA
jgi:hypothetical protein